MKEEELREHATCDFCGKTIGASNVPFFSTVETVSYQIDLMAVHRQNGLGQMIGARLAMAMGPDEDVAEEFSRETKTKCWDCMGKYFDESDS